ncbi:MAG TPA: phosphoenolpyruvate--protein phosphotransferase, partial [Pseudogracilibacillus sp.]|nr:phosphoenolpyruvate--protein phosphotransferase [Pseudogracilibacillus sp.]
TIIIANDLTPSDVAQMNSQHVKGIVTSIGGRTSHVSIMARSMELPAVVGTETAAQTIENGDDIIVDGNNGIIWINPTSRIQKIYKQRQQDFQAEKLAWSLLKNKPTITRDQHQVALVANISSSDEIENVLANGAEGIGLYRTEYLFMEKSTFPTEEEQFEVYKTVLKRMNDKPVVVRTLDIGGDKQLPYWNLPKEMNPFLGVRAIRLSLQEMDIFRTQLRALLRASSFGNLKIMFPMIAVIDEFLQAKQVLLEEKQKLHDQGIRVEKNIEIGIMVEIPATALLANQFAKEVDFFSIGTNDLIQYMFAADRLNEHVSYLYQPYHPAILRLIKLIIDAAHDEGKWVGMCGEMAGDPNAIPLLLGLGLDEFSMGASSILPARNHLKKLSKQDMEKLAQKALSLRTANDVLKLVHEH